MLCGINQRSSSPGICQAEKKGPANIYPDFHFAILQIQTLSLQIQLDDRILKTDAFFISVANSNRFGNEFTIAPKASLSDGLLDIVIVKKMSKLSLPFFVLHHVAGNNLPLHMSDVREKKNIIYLQTHKMSVRNRGLAPLHIDVRSYRNTGLV